MIRESFIVIKDHVSGELVGIAKSSHLQDTGSRRFDILLRKFNPVVPLVARATDGRKFVNPVQSRLIVCCYQSCPHTPDVDRGSLLFESCDEFFIKIIAGDDHSVLKSGLI